MSNDVEVRWDRLTAPALRHAVQDKTVVIIPLGATEQHGPHLPTQVDWRSAYEISLRAARLMAGRQRALVTPAIPFGMSEHHMSLGGTLTLDYATMAAVIGCVVRSAARHGFERIFVLNGHGGNIAALDTILTELTIELEAAACRRHLLVHRRRVHSRHSGAPAAAAPRLRSRDLDHAGAVSGNRAAARSVDARRPGARACRPLPGSTPRSSAGSICRRARPSASSARHGRRARRRGSGCWRPSRATSPMRWPISACGRRRYDRHPGDRSLDARFQPEGVSAPGAAVRRAGHRPSGLERHAGRPAVPRGAY